MTEVVFTNRAIRDLGALEAKDKTAILDRLRAVAEDPLRVARKLKDSRIGSYRYRFGDYRVIFDFEDGRVIILRIGHRKEIYR